MSGAASVVFEDGLTRYDFGVGHPLAPVRVDLTMRLAHDLGVVDSPDVEIVPAPTASDDELALVHSPAYIQAVRTASDSAERDLMHGLGTSDNPTFARMHEASASIVGASIEAARRVWSGEASHAVNISGGLHHAMADYASGFCIYNDPAIAIEWLLEQGAGTVVVHPPFRWQRDYARDFVKGIARLEADTGVAFAVENMYPWRASKRELQAYVPSWNPVAQAYANVTLDLSHTSTAGSDPLQMAAELGDRLRHVHLADGSGSAKDEHLVPGHGDQPCAELLERLASNGFAGNVIVEISTRRAPTRAARRADLVESLAFTRLHLGAADPTFVVSAAGEVQRVGHRHAG